MFSIAVTFPYRGLAATKETRQDASFALFYTVCSTAALGADRPNIPITSKSSVPIAHWSGRLRGE